MDSPRSPGPTPPQNNPPRNSGLWLLLIVTAVIAVMFFTTNNQKVAEITYGEFRDQLDQNNIASVTIEGTRIEGEYVNLPAKKPNAGGDAKSTDKTAAEKTASSTAVTKTGSAKNGETDKRFFTVLPTPSFADDQLDKLLRERVGLKYKAKEPQNDTIWVMSIYLLVTFALFFGLWLMFRRARDSIFSGGGLLGGFSKSGARRYDAGDKPITFKDVAGLENVKNDLQEIVEYLKNPHRFQRLGARVPKGILLMGPPGTGKTLLGRAVAGEAGVPFFAINGSEFIQMFVGVGAGRVRDLFNTAKENAPAILFIDEIDAVGRHRGTGVGGGHDEREQTLNQILSEMDGFTPTESVIVVAATNRPDVLDPALLRPGRFDRHITVDRPTLKGREEIFRVHVREVPLADDVDLRRLAEGTVGLTGADIRNLVNEAALWASRNDKDKVSMVDFDYARDKVLMGAKREEMLVGKEKSMTAYHEAGHALLAWLLPGLDRLHKVSIIPRGRALGVTQLLPAEDRMNISESELKSRLVFMLGGREAERLVFNERDAGAEDDLNKATQLARRMVTHWGMSEKLGPSAFRDVDDHPFLGREMAEPRRFSERTAQIIDEEVMRLLSEAAAQASQTLVENREKLEALAKALEENETIDDRDFERLLGPSPNNSNGSSSFSAEV